MLKSMEQEQELEAPAVASEEIKPEEVLSELVKVDEAAKAQELESLMPVSARKKRLFVFDELLDPAILKRYLNKPHMEMKVKVPKHKLTFPKFFAPKNTGLASIERVDSPEQEVWGITVDISEEDLSRLNRYKSAPERYHLKSIWVVDRGGLRYPAVCYVVSVPDDQPSKPSKELLETIIRGAKERRLPVEYISWLESLETL